MYNLKQKIDEYYDHKERGSKDRTYFYISEANKCSRALFYNLKNKTPKKFNARVKRILENGDYMHQRYMKVFAEMRILIAAEVVPVKNDLISGRADCIISDGKDLYVIDLKSCSQWVFNSLAEPKEDDKIQLMLYMYFFNIPRGILLYENKDNQTMKTFEIELDKKRIEKLLKKLEDLKEKISKNIEPDCEPSVDKCKYCDYKKTCEKAIK